MKPKLKLILLTVIALLGLMPKHVMAQCPLPPQPVCFTVADGVNSLWSVTLNYSPTDPSYVLQPGTPYNGWCLQFNAAIATGFEYCGATLRYLDGPLPSHLTEYASPVVNQLNYIINNTSGASMLDVQFAMWNILQGFELTTQPSIDLASNAVVFGSAFVPSPIQKRAAILDLGPSSAIQRVIVEVSCGGSPPPPLEQCAQEAVGTPSINNNATYAFALGTLLGNDFITGPESLKFLQQPDGSLVLTGVVVRASNPNMCFTVNVTFSGPTGAPPAPLYPIKNIASATTNGWTYYTSVAGTLVGQKGLAGTNLFIAATGAQFGFGANNNNLLNGYFSSIFWGTTLGTVTNGGVLAGQIIECPTVDHICLNQALPVPGVSGGHAFFLPGIGSDFVAGTVPLRFVESSNGKGSITGVVFSASNPCKSFIVDIALSGLTSAGPGSPKLELPNSYYVPPVGTGIVDTNGWHYYSNMVGTLTGVGCYAGGQLKITNMGPAPQFGVGANGKNTNDGGSAWFNVTVVKQPTSTAYTLAPTAGSHGDFNLDDAPCLDEEVCVKEAFPALVSGGHAVYLPGIGTDFIASSGPLKLTKYEDGTALLSGNVYSKANPNLGFAINVNLSGLIEPPAPAPSGSPKLELPASAYLPTGPVDTNKWSYYTALSGTLTGLGQYTGGSIAIARMGPSFQLGYGANGKNTNDGGSGWFTVTVTKNPTTGGAFCPTSHGDFNLDITPCTFTPPPPPQCVGTGTPGYWKNHPEAWPVSSIVIGGKTYTKAQGIAAMGTSPAGDNTYTMFRHLISAKLNVLFGNNSSCIDTTITAADQWLVTYPLGSGVAGGSAAWTTGAPLATKLDDYNNGRLACAQHRDSLTCAPSTCPTAPTDLVLTVNALGKVVLTWSDNSATETGFIIQRKTGANGTWAALPGVAVNTTTYTDTTVAICTTYCYRVRTSNCAEYTAEVCITTPQPCPNPPSNLVLGSKVAGKIVICWTDNSTSESCFQIERKTGTGAWIKIGQVAANCTTFTDSTVQPCVSYIYRIRTCECADYSNELTVTSAAAPIIGTGKGLVGEYFDSINFTSSKLTRIDCGICFDWGTGSPATSIGCDTFSVRWSGQVQAQYTDTYTFYVTGDDGYRLWVNGQLIINNYVDQGPTEKSGTISLVAGQKYDIKLEYYENTGGASVRLAWSSNCSAKEIIPCTQLYGTCGDGLKGEYYNAKDLTCYKFTRLDANVCFDWGYGSPASTINADCFSVRWTGQIQAQVSETYTFYVNANNGYRLWVNGTKIVDLWGNTTTTETSGTIALVAGQKYDIKLEYFENTGTASAILSWSSATTPKQVVPKCVLFSGGYTGRCDVSVPWQTRDIGNCARPGETKESYGDCYIKGSGSDIWGSSDECHKMFQNAVGDCEIKAKICSVGNTDPWAKCGVMIRESLNGNSSHAFMCLTAGNGLAFQRRNGTGAASEHTSGGNDGSCWVKLVRRGSTFTSYKSRDGVSWTQVGSCNIPMASNCYIGIAVTSHNSALTSECKVSNVTVVP